MLMIRLRQVTMPKRELVDLEGAILAETPMAILFSLDGERKGAVWLPKSQIEIERLHPEGCHATITMPERLAVEKGLV